MTGLFEYYVCAQSQNRSSKIHLFSFENIQNSSVNLAILWLNNRIQMTMPLVVWAFLNYTFFGFYLIVCLLVTKWCHFGLKLKCDVCTDKAKVTSGHTNLQAQKATT